MLLRLQASVLVALATVAISSATATARTLTHQCVVPSLKHDSLRTAGKRLVADYCAVGKTTGPRGGVVDAQDPKAGRRERPGTRIKLTLKLPSQGTAASTAKPVAGTVPSGSITPQQPGLTQTTPTTTAGTTPPATTTTITPPTTPPSTPPQPDGVAGNWNLILDSEFDGPSLDTSIWQPGWFGTGVTAADSAEAENCFDPNNITFPGDGSMHLNVTAAPSTCGLTEPYTGALVTTDPNDGRASGGFEYTYGVVEARVYIPLDGTLVGDWPAIWTDGDSWPADGEDDVMEGLSGLACASFHYLQSDGTAGDIKHCDHALSPGWHTFASDWEPGSITYYYDGTLITTFTTGITSAPMYIALDNSVSSLAPLDLIEADSMQVKYVRVWQSQG